MQESEESEELEESEEVKPCPCRYMKCPCGCGHRYTGLCLNKNCEACKNYRDKLKVTN